MRALLGPLNRRDHQPVVGDLDGSEVRLFDRAHADIAFDPAVEPLEAIFGRLPAGWQPQCLIWWSPEYSLLPEGIERCPVPSIAVLGDWNLGLWATAPLLEAFDAVVTDRAGVQALRPQLGVPVDYWPVFSFDRARHRREPRVPRDIDVLFVGNMNHDVQTERAPWLARLARLGRRRRVLLASGVWGDAYAELLRRARIVWNRSIRGELNMRAYEAPASGALLFMEEENLEARDVFADGVSCVLYNGAALEARLEEYLAHPERLDRVAEAGWQRVQTETYADHLARLLGAAANLRRGPRPFAALPPWRRDYWLALHALSTGDALRIGAAFRHLARALGRTDDRGAVAGALGALGAMAAAGAPRAATQLDQAIRLIALAQAAHPEDAITRANFAWVSAARGRRELARSAWLAAHAYLESEQPFPLDRLPLPFGFDRFRTEWERAAVPADLGARAAGFRLLLRARIAAELAMLEDDAEGAAGWWARSVGSCPGIEQNVARLGGALDAAGYSEVAAEAYARALGLNPFDWATRAAAVQLALRAGDAPTVDRLLGEGRDLSAAAPACAEWMAAVEALLARPVAVS